MGGYPLLGPLRTPITSGSVNGYVKGGEKKKVGSTYLQWQKKVAGDKKGGVKLKRIGGQPSSEKHSFDPRRALPKGTGTLLVQRFDKTKRGAAPVPRLTKKMGYPKVGRGVTSSKEKKK